MKLVILVILVYLSQKSSGYAYAKFKEFLLKPNKVLGLLLLLITYPLYYLASLRITIVGLLSLMMFGIASRDFIPTSEISSMILNMNDFLTSKFGIENPFPSSNFFLKLTFSLNLFTALLLQVWYSFRLGFESFEEGLEQELKQMKSEEENDIRRIE